MKINVVIKEIIQAFKERDVSEKTDEQSLLCLFRLAQRDLVIWADFRANTDQKL